MEENICQVVQYIYYEITFGGMTALVILAIEKSTTYNRSSLYGTTIKRK